MNLLILGGTAFVGRHIVTQALARGHQVTLAHRGQTGTDLFPECEHLHFDRLSAWPEITQFWDAVVDTSAYVPRAISSAAEHLQGRTAKYLFISTVSVYDVEGQLGLDENSPLWPEPETPTEEITAQTYGPLKVACERVASEAWGDSLIVIRPGIIVGKWDPTDRFEYWAREVARGGSVPVPARMDQPIQVIDGSDLARFCLDRLAGDGGVWNATGPAAPITFGQMLDEMRSATGSGATWDPKATAELPKSPMVLPEDGSRDAIFRCSSAKAIADGLVHRPLRESVLDAIA